MPEPTKQNTNAQAPAPAPAAEAGGERTFTQSEMNAILADRLARERGKYADYDALKAKAEQFDRAEEAGKTELQKANERAAALKQQLDSLNRENTLRTLRADVSQKTGVPADLLTADTGEECARQAEAILSFAKSLAGYPAVRDGGALAQNPAGSPAEQFAAWFEQAAK